MIELMGNLVMGRAGEKFNVKTYDKNGRQTGIEYVIIIRPDGTISKRRRI